MNLYKIDKNKIREHIKKIGLKNQNELAEKMGITKNQLSAILSPEYDFLKSNIRELCNILNTDITSIISVEAENLQLFSSGSIELKKEKKLEKNNNLQSLNILENLEVLEKLDIVDNNNDSTNISKENNSLPSKKYNVIEFFAGAGGLALGLEKAGFSTLLLNEFDKHASSTLRKNRPHWKVLEEDIVTVTEKGISSYLDENCEVDLISGGYPCQAFSYAGKGLGLEDARGTLFYPFAKTIEELKPKMFLAENVKGLVSHDNGNTLKTMIQVYESLGYDVQYKVMNALDYGVAQKRERVAIVGIRRDLKEKYNLEYKFPEPFGYRLALKDILKNVPPSEITPYSEKKKEIMKLVPPGGCWRDLPDEIAREYMGASYFLGGGKTGMARKLSWDEPGLTVLCSPSQKQTERCHPDEIRPFTVRENARIQSFPDDWEFVGPVSAKYKQIGNAVPVNFAEAIGKSLIALLNKIGE